MLAALHPALGSELFEAGKMTAVKLDGVTVYLGNPVQVTEGVGHLWFPTIGRFPTGELIVTYGMSSDSNANSADPRGYQISKDGGKTWGYQVVMDQIEVPLFLPQDDGSLLAVSGCWYHANPDDLRNLFSPYVRFEAGGDRIVIEPSGARVVDFPWPVHAWPTKRPRINWISELKFTGNVLRIGQRLITLANIREAGAEQAARLGVELGQERLFQRVVALVSEDEGRTWRYLSTVADATALPDSLRKKIVEWRGGGPSEAAMIQLADGDLMSVFRVCSGSPPEVLPVLCKLYRAYSSDQGLTWTRAEPIPPYAVQPGMLRLENGTIAVSAGRPFPRFWISTDPRGETWQDVDIIAHHNQWAPDPTYQIGAVGDRWQTTSYTEIVEVAPNRLLLVYDRTPFAWKPTPGDSNERNRIFVLPIEIERR